MAQDVAQKLVTRGRGAKEIVTMEVNGQLHTDWTSVRVEAKAGGWAPTFMFETTEESPLPLKALERQFKPGDWVKVYVGGQLVVSGYITERHVSYDAQQHGIRLIGTGHSFDLTKATVREEDRTGNDGMSAFEIAKKISAYMNIKIEGMGNVDGKPFPRVGIAPGELVSTVIERHARMRNIVIGSTFRGGLLMIGENEVVSSGDLVEMINILRANCVIRDIPQNEKYFATTQEPGGSNASGGAAANHKVEAPGYFTRPGEKTVVAEISADDYDLRRRVAMEQVFSEGAELEARITVQGFFKDMNKSDFIWRAGEYYGVNAPMLMLPGVVLGCMECVYEQSDAGSTTTLTMVKPIHLNGLLNFRAGQALENALRQSELRPRAPQAANPPGGV
jgi:prophage tail gpP-like protein